MSFQAQAWAAAQKTGNPLTKAVLMALANYANQDGESWYSYARIASDTEMGESTVRKHVAALVDLGLLIVEHRTRENGSQSSNLYRLILGATTCTPSPHDVNPPSSRRGTPEPSREPSGESHGVTSSSEAQSRSDDSDEQAELFEGPPRQPKTKRRAPETPLPDDWQPTDRHREFAQQNGLDLALEVVKFRGHAEANDRRQRSWNGAFSTWLANAVTYQRNGNGNHDGNGATKLSPWNWPQKRHDESVADYYARVAEAQRSTEVREYAL